MPQEARTNHPLYNLLPREIEGFGSLSELALNLRWSWNHATDQVWRQLDPTFRQKCIPMVSIRTPCESSCMQMVPMAAVRSDRR